MQAESRMDEPTGLLRFGAAEIPAGSQRGFPTLALHQDYRAQLDHGRVLRNMLREGIKLGDRVVEHSEFGVALGSEDGSLVSFDHQASRDSSSATRWAKSWRVASTGAG